MAAVYAAQPVGVEERLAGDIRLGRRPDRFEPVERSIPQRAHTLGIGRNEPELGTAGQRLPHPHARFDAERLGRGGDLSHQLRPARLWRQGGRLGEQHMPIPERRDEGKTGDQHAHDHKRTHVRIRVG